VQRRKPKLPPSRAVLVILPLQLIEALDKAADVLGMSRSDVIRRSLGREAASALRDEVARVAQRMHGQVRPAHWSV
jgi:hypothetical protein